MTDPIKKRIVRALAKRLLARVETPRAIPEPSPVLAPEELARLRARSEPGAVLSRGLTEGKVAAERAKLYETMGQRAEVRREKDGTFSVIARNPAQKQAAPPAPAAPQGNRPPYFGEGLKRSEQSGGQGGLVSRLAKVLEDPKYADKELTGKQWIELLENDARFNQRELRSLVAPLNYTITTSGLRNRAAKRVANMEQIVGESVDPTPPPEWATPERLREIQQRRLGQYEKMLNDFDAYRSSTTETALGPMLRAGAAPEDIGKIIRAIRVGEEADVIFDTYATRTDREARNTFRQLVELVRMTNANSRSVRATMDRVRGMSPQEFQAWDAKENDTFMLNGSVARAWQDTNPNPARYDDSQRYDSKAKLVESRVTVPDAADMETHFSSRGVGRELRSLVDTDERGTLAHMRAEMPDPETLHLIESQSDAFQHRPNRDYIPRPYRAWESTEDWNMLNAAQLLNEAARRGVRTIQLPRAGEVAGRADLPLEAAEITYDRALPKAIKKQLNWLGIEMPQLQRQVGDYFSEFEFTPQMRERILQYGVPALGLGALGVGFGGFGQRGEQ